MSEVSVPEGWSVNKIGNICHTIYRYPTFYGMETYATGIPVLRGEHILTNGKLSLDWYDYTYVSEEFSNQYPKTKLEIGDVVMAVRGTVGKFAKVGKSHINAQISPNLIRLAPDTEQVDSDFFFQSLFSIKDNLLKTNVSATGVPALNGSDIKESSINYPPLPEQQKIASILTSVDDVIEKTQSQINKLQDLKKGTMNELLTRGIGHTEFVDSPVGKIPKGWEVNQLGDLGRFKNGLNKGKEDFGFGTLFVNISDAYPERLQCNSLSRLNANERDLKEYGLTNGDIIFVRSSVKPEGVGYPTLFRGHDEEVVYCGFMIRYRFDKDILYPEFLVYALKQERFRREVMKVATISANTNINQDALSKLFISIPTQEEQQKISSILSSIDKTIEENQRKLEQAKFLKKSLMNDLLTGKVRVPLQ